MHLDILSLLDKHVIGFPMNQLGVLYLILLCA